MLDKTNKNMTLTKMKKNISELVRDYSIEMMPKDGRYISKFHGYLEQNTFIYVANPPNTTLDEVISVAIELREAGFNPVPHILARELRSQDFLKDALDRLQKAKINQILFLAGDKSVPVGPFTSTLDLFETGIFQQFDIKKIGVAGHPEGSSYASQSLLANALDVKNSFAQNANVKLHIVSQIDFDPENIISWSEKINDAGNRLPIHVGLPGPTKLKSLLKYASIVGVGPSIRSLKKKASLVSNLLTVSTPDKIIMEIAKYRSEEEGYPFTKLHFYSFAGVKRTAKWANAIINGKFHFLEDGNGFEVDLL